MCISDVVISLLFYFQTKLEIVHHLQRGNLWFVYHNAHRHSIMLEREIGDALLLIAFKFYSVYREWLLIMIIIMLPVSL